MTDDTPPPTTTSAAEPCEPLWDDERIAEWLDDHWLGVGSAEAMGAEMRHDYEAKLDEYQARIAELERAYAGLTELNKRNCNDALRIKGASDAVLALMFLVNDDIKVKDARIGELEAENRELSRMVSLEFEQAMKASNNNQPDIAIPGIHVETICAALNERILSIKDLSDRYPRTIIEDAMKPFAAALAAIAQAAELQSQLDAARAGSEGTVQDGIR